jgi:hypothetical protein
MTKLAYLFGANYPTTQYPLNGCINDVDNMNLFLTSKGWTVNLYKENVVTRKFFLTKLLELVLSGADQLFVHFSGHGSNQADTNNDEIDKTDEGIVVYVEYSKTEIELVIDDEIKGILQCLKPHQMMYLCFDCCHSASICDLGWNIYKKMNSNKLMLVRDTKELETNGQVICLSGCADNSTSADAFINGKSQGAFTRAFLDSYKSNKTWEQLINDIQTYMVQNKYSQVPAMSCGKNFNLLETLKL